MRFAALTANSPRICIPIRTKAIQKSEEKFKTRFRRFCRAWQSGKAQALRCRRDRCHGQRAREPVLSRLRREVTQVPAAATTAVLKASIAGRASFPIFSAIFSESAGRAAPSPCAAWTIATIWKLAFWKRSTARKSVCSSPITRHLTSRYLQGSKPARRSGSSIRAAPEPAAASQETLS